jgi:excisionase family DNA binding protein
VSVVEDMKATKKRKQTVFTVGEVERILGTRKLSAYHAVARGDIPSVRIGRRILIPRQAVRQLLTEYRVPSRRPDARWFRHQLIPKKAPTSTAKSLQYVAKVLGRGLQIEE